MVNLSVIFTDKKKKDSLFVKEICFPRWRIYSWLRLKKRGIGFEVNLSVIKDSL